MWSVTSVFPWRTACAPATSLGETSPCRSGSAPRCTRRPGKSSLRDSGAGHHPGHRFNFRALMMKSKKHIHLIGICGTAMASLAGMLNERGFRVTGSDAAAYPPMSDFLASLGIPRGAAVRRGNLEPRPDLVVVGNAISRGNVELEYVLDERIPFCSLPQILHESSCAARKCWWSPGPTARPRRPPCWRGFSSPPVASRPF